MNSKRYMNFEAKHGRSFILEKLMGPNAPRMLERLLEGADIRPNMRVLDLGCGQALTSLFLAQEYDVEVYATDLWVKPTENYKAIKHAGLENKIVPIYADATALPFAHAYFDAVVSVDAYHYFGRDAHVMDECIAPFVKPGGLIAIAIPGLTQEFSPMPDVFAPYFDQAGVDTFHSIGWWKELLEGAEMIDLKAVHALDCFDACWADWLSTDNPYAVSDRAMIRDAAEYMNLIGILAQRKG